MRIRIVFSLKNKGACIPFHHQHLLSDFIGHLMARSGNGYRNYPFVNFSGLKGQTKISRLGLHFYSSKVTLVVASYSEDYLNTLIKNIFSYPQIQLANLELIPDSVEKEVAPDFTEEVKYVCISPIVLSEPEQDNYHAKKFIPPEVDSFSDLLYESLMSRMELSGDFSPQQISSFFKFQLIPDKIYLKKIKEDHKKFARIYTIPKDRSKIEVRGYTLPFTLYAAPEVQEFIFNCGLGVYCNKGFGMLDVANENPIKRTTIYFPE